MKENKIEKLVLDLSNRWDCSPEEAVDRLNSMNESEINKLINSMTKKFAKGGMIDCLRNGGKPKDCGCGAKIKKEQTGGEVSMHRNDGVNGDYTKKILPDGTVSEVLSRRNPDESVSYTERQITPQNDTTYYKYSNVTPMIDQHVQGNKYVTPTAYNEMGWLKKLFNRVRPSFWDKAFARYEKGGELKKEMETLPKKKKEYLKK